MELDGLDALLSKLERMDKEIDDDVDKIVRNNTIEMTGDAKKNGQQRFNKGYATGYTVRNIETQRLDKMHYKTLSKSEHSGYIEWGTRFMSGTLFLFDAYNQQRKQFLADLDRLVK
ncbi:HK97-gp10 family putative phage morphogenesis protein [Alkalibacillus salilacus]|uniref:HK97 gp10 family phage protein n=1 Tax=Alkalibacillus salilacus TaxID=284582 RepID=A0ABT9VD02_9BACI|nr:HK97-gp10 family putative phage morphogenesis protein [Alkalibacillus salilacus]MDQ0158807.1 HK97 gp10 family phage protein [Alkalibacillus salilacus]